MSSAQFDEGDVTIIKTKVTVNQTEVTAPASEASTFVKAEIKELGEDLGKVGKSALKSLSGFRTFILRGNVVDLAIGIVIGAAFTSVVTSLVGDVITPIIPLPGKNSLGNLNIPLPPIYPKGSEIHIGTFINALISFLIVAAVLYFFVVQPVNSLMKLYHPKEAEAKETRECPYCFQAINIKATRCPFCTSRLRAENGNGHHEEQDPVLMLPESLEKLSEQLAEKIVTKATTQLEKTAVTAEAGATDKE